MSDLITIPKRPRGRPSTKVNAQFEADLAPEIAERIIGILQGPDDPFGAKPAKSDNVVRLTPGPDAA